MAKRIFKITDAKDRSIFSKVYPPSLRVQYKKEEYVEPKTPVLAFRYKKDAIKFLPNTTLGLTPFKMWRCKAEGIKKVEKIMAPSVLFNPGVRRMEAINKLKSFWKGGFLQTESPLKGTISAKRIKLIKQIMVTKKVKPYSLNWIDIA